MRKLILLYSIAALLVLFISSCTKVNNTSPMALVGLHLHSSIDTTQIDPAVTDVYLPDANGRLERLNVAQFYLTNLAFHNKSTQAWYTIPGSIILKRITNEIYPVGNIPAATYDAIRFSVGLNDTLDGRTPSWYPTAGSADTVLSVNEQAAMWLSNAAGTNANTGYTFMNIQGYDSTDHVAFSYQLGGLGDTVQISIPYSAGFTIAANEPTTLQLIHVIADYGILLRNINLRTAPNGSFYSTTPANVANAYNVWANIVNMFYYECPVPNGDC